MDNQQKNEEVLPKNKQGCYGCGAGSFEVRGPHAPEMAEVFCSEVCLEQYAEEHAVAQSATKTLGDLQKMAMAECIVAEWPDYPFVTELMFLASEVSEAFEAWRDYHDFGTRYPVGGGKPEGVAIELADVVIGVLYIAEKYGFDLAEAIRIKHRFNLTRNYRLGGRVPT